MYYPIQIPYILSREFSESITYAETPAAECNGLVICFWEMRSVKEKDHLIENIIVADGCIDLVAGYDDREIGFSGMSKTDFHFPVKGTKSYFGARLMPGAFRQLTGLPAAAAMDTFLPVESIFPDFDCEYLFSLSYSCANNYFKQFMKTLTADLSPDLFTGLFDKLAETLPVSAEDLYQELHFSARQCQRLFALHYGITPKMSLSIVRFQRCLQILTSKQSDPSDIMNILGYYDQPHFIKDFKRNIGITPLELIQIYHS